jgi:hypothetical protein
MRMKKLLSAVAMLLALGAATTWAVAHAEAHGNEIVSPLSNP